MKWERKRGKSEEKEIDWERERGGIRVLKILIPVKLDRNEEYQGRTEHPIGKRKKN